MTISTTAARKSLACNGVTTAFSFPYRFLTNADLVVTLVTEADGTETTLTLDTHYTVTGAGADAGGTITTVATYSNAYTLVVVRQVAVTQETDFVENDALPVEDVETALDRLTMIAQQQQESLDRSIKFSIGVDVTEGNTTLPVPADLVGMYVAFDASGNLVPASGTGADDGLRTDIAASSGSSLVGFLQAGTGAVPTDLEGEVQRIYRPQQFGAVGDWNGSTGTDDTAAIRKCCAAVQAAGGGIIDFGKYRYRIYSDTGDTASIGDFTSVTGLEFIFSGGELVVNRAFTGSQTVQLFKFTDCHNVRFHGANLSCTETQPTNQKTSRGPSFALFLQGCTGVSSDSLKISSFRSGWDIRRSVGDPDSYISKGFDLGVTAATNVGYPLSTAYSGDSIKATLITTGCGRSYFPQGSMDHDIRVVSKNHEASDDCLIVPTAGRGMENLYLSYTNRESTGADNSLNCVYLQVQDSDTYDAVFRNIHIHLNIKTTASEWLGFGVHIGKTKSDDTADTTDRGHILENIKISGSITGGSANQRSLGLFNVGTWGLGEYVRNIRLKDLWMGVVGQPAITLTSLQDQAILDNVYCSAQMNLVGNTTGRIICIGVKCDAAITDSAADTSNATYIGCSIGSAGNQSVINKSFVDTTIAGSMYSAEFAKLVTATYSTSITLDAAAGPSHVITATNGVAFAINAPSNPVVGKRISVTIRNAAGGPLGAVTWNAVFKMSAWTQPANGFSRTIDFIYNGSEWVQAAQTGVDIPN